MFPNFPPSGGVSDHPAGPRNDIFRNPESALRFQRVSALDNRLIMLLEYLSHVLVYTFTSARMRSYGLGGEVTLRNMRSAQYLRLLLAQKEGTDCATDECLCMGGGETFKVYLHSTIY